VPAATACPPSVVADTIMRTIELGVMITDARCRREADDDLLQPGGPRRQVSGRRPGGPLPRH
jgi:hypothetical protein